MHRTMTTFLGSAVMLLWATACPGKEQKPNTPPRRDPAARPAPAKPGRR